MQKLKKSKTLAKFWSLIDEICGMKIKEIIVKISNLKGKKVTSLFVCNTCCHIYLCIETI